MKTYDEDFLRTLRDLCLRYDKRFGSFPEDKYQGFSLYDFAVHGEPSEHTNEREAEWEEELER